MRDTPSDTHSAARQIERPSDSAAPRSGARRGLRLFAGMDAGAWVPGQRLRDLSSPRDRRPADQWNVVLNSPRSLVPPGAGGAVGRGRGLGAAPVEMGGAEGATETVSVAEGEG